MKFRNYKIDSFYLSMIIGVLATSLFFPYILLSVFVLLIFGLKKDDDKEG
ncbi:hypothetical protein [Staphylococcus aureus]|nr:hypothetical protein [Staphylococcus aureus]CPC24420.1 Uncharacterised protein [Staphylococcus aureus]